MNALASSVYLILPLFPGHPDKRFYIVIRGEPDEDQEQGGSEAVPAALQPGVQTTG